MIPFRREPVDTRQPLMPGRKTRWRMFRLHFYLGFLVIVGWGFVWAGIEYALHLTHVRPITFKGFLAVSLDAPQGFLNWVGSPYNPEWSFTGYALSNDVLQHSGTLTLLGHVVIDLLLIVVVSLVFGALCHRKRKLSLRPFVILVALLMVNCVASQAYTHYKYSGLGITRLSVATDQARYAARDGDIDRRDKWAAEARRLVQEDAEFYYNTNRKTSPLRIFAGMGDVDTMQVLIAHGADVNGATAHHPPLRLAVWGGHVEAVELLLNNGAELGEAITEVGFGPEDTAMAEMLIARGADVNESGYDIRPLEGALHSNNFVVGRYLVEQGADIDAAEEGLQNWRRPRRADPALVKRMLMRLRALEVESASETTP